MLLVKKIYKFFWKGSWLEKKLIVQSFVYMLVIRHLMLKVKFKRYQKYLGERGVESTRDYSAAHDEIIKTVRRIVLSTSKNTPWESKCMVQAVSCKWLLKKYGVESTIYFGIKPDEENKGKLKAHAWLRVGEYIVTGREGHKAFKVVNFYA